MAGMPTDLKPVVDGLHRDLALNGAADVGLDRRSHFELGAAERVAR